MGSLRPESVLIGHVADSVLHTVRSQVRVAALADENVCVADVFQGTLISGRNSVGSHIAQRVLTVLVVHFSVLQDRNVPAVGTSEDGHTAQSEDDKLRR